MSHGRNLRFLQPIHTILNQRKIIVAISRVVFCLFLLLNVAQISSIANAQAINYSVANQRIVGSLVLSHGRTLGSCFYVDQRGYIATCFSNIPAINQEINVVFPDGNRFQLTGIVAASPGKDIVIAQIEPEKKGVSQYDYALKLDVNSVPEIGEPLVAWGGPAAVRAAAAAELPQVKRRMLGEEFLAGMARRSQDRIGCDPDTKWFWLSLSRHVSCNGAPVFNRDGSVVGMLSGCQTGGDAVFTAIHAEHIHQLIPQIKVKPKALKLLKNWPEELPVAESLDKIHQSQADWVGLGGALQRSNPLVERFQDQQSRLVKIQQERAELQKQRSKYQSDNLELLAKVEPLELELRKITPEEAYKETIREKVVDREVNEDGKVERKEREVTRVVTRHRYSARQRDMMKPMQDEIAQLRKSIQSNSDRSAFAAQIAEPFVVQLEQTIENELFFIADPLALQSKQQHIDLETAITDQIEQGGAGGELYLTRAILRCQLKDFAGCESDCNEAVEINSTLRLMSEVINIRSLLLQRDPKAPSKLKAVLDEAKISPHALTILARSDIDTGELQSALRKLQSASKLIPNELEILHGIAWLTPYASPNSSLTNAKHTTAPAFRLVQETGGLDWSARAALAAAHIVTGNTELARQQLDAAKSRAITVDAIDQCDQWLEQLTNSNRIDRVW